MFLVTGSSSAGVACSDDRQEEEKENDTSDKETEQQHKQNKTLQDPLVQHEQQTGHLSEQELCKLKEEEKAKECEAVVKGEHDSDPLSNHHKRKQEDRMVIEAGSKAAEIAKTVFGKHVYITPKILRNQVQGTDTRHIQTLIPVIVIPC